MNTEARKNIVEDEMLVLYVSKVASLTLFPVSVPDSNLLTVSYTQTL